MESGIKGKVALVTAASKGIGKAVAEAFASEECKVAICSRTKSDLIETSKEIKEKYRVDPLWCICDLIKKSDIERTYKATVKEYGKVDILVNNCGGPVPGYLLDLEEKDWNHAYEHVLMSVVRFSRLVLPDMMKNEWGRIINITSIAVKQPIDNLMLSNSLRAGVTGFAKSLSTEAGKHNITVNNVAPGLTLTHRLYELAVVEGKENNKSHEEVLADMAKRVPMHRLAGPEEIASVVLFLASKQASYVTGTTIQVDGGHTKGLM